MPFLNYIGSDKDFSTQIMKIDETYVKFIRSLNIKNRQDIQMLLYMHCFQQINSVYIETDPARKQWVTNSLNDFCKLLADLKKNSDAIEETNDVSLQQLSTIYRAQKIFHEDILKTLITITRPIPNDIPAAQPTPPTPPPTPPIRDKRFFENCCSCFKPK
jgi:hypothetical protein